MPAGPSALERLLETEQRLDSLVEDEARQAEAILQGARDEAATLEQRLAEELAACEREVESRLAAERDARLAFVQDEADRALARFAAITPDQVSLLAEWVVEQVLGNQKGDGP